VSVGDDGGSSGASAHDARTWRDSGGGGGGNDDDNSGGGRGSDRQGVANRCAPGSDDSQGTTASWAGRQVPHSSGGSATAGGARDSGDRNVPGLGDMVDHGASVRNLTGFGMRETGRDDGGGSGGGGGGGPMRTLGHGGGDENDSGALMVLDGDDDSDPSASAHDTLPWHGSGDVGGGGGRPLHGDRADNGGGGGGGGGDGDDDDDTRLCLSRQVLQGDDAASGGAQKAAAGGSGPGTGRTRQAVARKRAKQKAQRHARTLLPGYKP